MTILFGLVFSVINPLLPPMCVVYFFIANLTEKYNILYIERPQYQSGGQVPSPTAMPVPAGTPSHNLLSFRWISVMVSMHYA